ncbi:MAG: glutamine--fructose-6-phosphate transaminase (isomerizing), partial [Elusimicrobia bacterium]|nr:glutamine--fructose-6-phosphate transaminase (isomerizing) [Elusimicrobiota bacterium]
PHRDCTQRIVVVHNGIIENYSQIKSQLSRKGHAFLSQTDTEVIAHLIEEEWRSAGRRLKEKEFFNSVRKALSTLEGAYAVGILSADFPEILVVARKDCPLVLGVGKDGNYIASDIPALLPHTRKTIFLGQEEMAILKKDKIECFNLNGKKVRKPVLTVNLDPVQAEKSNFKHFMLKEIMEQPTAVQDTLRGRLLIQPQGLPLDIGLSLDFLKHCERVTFAACGTSFHAAQVGRFWFERLCRIPCSVEIASEFRYRDQFLNAKHLSIFISQSGETADTLAALRIAKKTRARTLAICNVLGSTITSESQSTLYTHCGPEIGVASTKAFTGQLTALLLLAIHLGIVRGSLDLKSAQTLAADFLKLPQWIRETLEISGNVRSIAKRFVKKSHFLYLGRNLNYPIALEGALKLKEISYIHAEGYPAGEMKHGPIALIDREMPIVALVTQSSVYEKIHSNIQEAKARGGTILAVATQGDKFIQGTADETLFVPKIPEIFSPIVNVVPLQLFAYHMADLRGCDVDQPRNLAKSVTVE